MPRRLRRAALLAIVALVLGMVGCGGNDDSLTGTWTGAFHDSLGLQGGGNLSLSQSGTSLGGTWQVTFGATKAAYSTNGSVDGTVQGNAISAQLTSRLQCPFILSATRSADHIVGTYAAVNCPFTQTGSIDLQRASR